MQLQVGPSVRMILRRPGSAMLIAGEVAFSIVLIVHVVVMQRHMHLAIATDTHLAPDTLYVVDADGDDVPAKLRALGGVEAVARVDRPPHELTQLSLAVESRSRRVARAWSVSGTPELGRVLGLEIVAGEPLGAAAVGEGEPALVTESLARALFGPERAIGQLIDAPPRRRPLRVVGVVRDVLVASAWSLGAANAIISTSPAAGRRAPWLVRASHPRFIAEAERALATSRFVSIESMRQRLAHGNVRGVFLLSLGAVLLLTLAGTTGAATMVSLFITARTREIGLRRALGARRGEVVGQMVVEALVISGTGAAYGVVLSFVVARLTDTPAGELDPPLLVSAVAAVLCLTVLSSFFPSRRAANIPPAIAGKTL